MSEADSLLGRLRGSLAPLTPVLILLSGLVFFSEGRLARAEGPPERILIPAEKFRSQPGDASTATAPDSAETDRRFNFEGFRQKVDGLWFKRKAFLKKNLTEAAAEQIEGIEDLGREVGVTRLDTIAASLVREGRGFLEEGNFEKAIRSFNGALRFASDLPEAHFGLASAQWRGGSIGRAVGALCAGTRAFVQSRTLSSAALGNILILSVLAIACTAVLISAAMIIRYQSLVRHDLVETLAARYPGKLSKEALRLLGWVVLALPLLTWIVAVWAPVYWLTLTFRYQNAREKAISGALFLLLVLSAPAARASEILFALAADPSARLMLASTSLSYDPEQVVILTERAEANPQDPAFRFLLGCLYSRGRYFSDALSEYRRVIELDSRSYRAYNNMGNIFLRSGQPEEAVKNYRAAISLRRDFLPAYYNIYLARKELLQLREGETALKEGQRVDADGMASLVEGAKTRGVGEPVDAVISREEVFARILGEGHEHDTIAASFISVPSILVASFFFAAVLLARVLGRRHAGRCVKCGAAFCHRCKAGPHGPEYCSQCQQVFLGRDGLWPDIRREKISDSERFRASQARLSRMTSVVFPGMSRLLDGRTATGAIASAVWCGSVLALALRPHLLYLASTGDARPFLLVTTFLGLLAAAAWLLGNLRSVRDAGIPAGAWRWR